MHHDNWKEAVADLRIENNDLRDRIRSLDGRLSNALVDLRHARAKLRDAGLSTEPYEVDEDEYECGECAVRLEPEWFACAGCGRVIDWDATHPLNGRDWYAEEGERFLQEAVYDPIREVMRS